MAAATAPATLGDLANMQYTRGGPGDADNRGATLVEKHNERMQTERENMALDKLAALMPAVGGKLRAFALAKTEWDVDAALNMLRSFQVAQLDKLNAIMKKRKRIQEDAEDAAEAGPGGGNAASGGSGGTGSSSSSGSDGSSGSGDSDADGGSDGGRKTGKRRRSRKSSKRSGKDKRSKKKRRRDSGGGGGKKKRGEDKDKRRRGGERSGGGVSKAKAMEFGKFGVIREADADRKRSEFLMWALDVKKLDVEALAKWEEKELFKEFVEEFNTGGLPHRKYYDLAAYEMAKIKEEAERAAAKAAAKTGSRKAKELGDEQELHRRRLEQAKKEQDKRVKEAMDALRRGGMAEEMRRQEMLRLEMALAYKTGDKAKAQRIMERLAPDDPAKKR